MAYGHCKPTFLPQFTRDNRSSSSRGFEMGPDHTVSCPRCYVSVIWSWGSLRLVWDWRTRKRGTEPVQLASGHLQAPPQARPSKWLLMCCLYYRDHLLLSHISPTEEILCFCAPAYLQEKNQGQKSNCDLSCTETLTCTCPQEPHHDEKGCAGFMLQWEQYSMWV